MNVGGKERGILNLINAMPEEIFENHLYVFKAGGFMLQAIDRKKCRVAELGRRAGGDYHYYYKLFRLFREHRIDLAHTRSWGTLLEGMLAALAARVPAMVHSEHGFMRVDTRKHIWIQSLAWRCADRVMCVSEKLRDTLHDKIGFPKERMQVIRNGVDLDAFDAMAGPANIRAELGLAPGTLLIGSVGRLVPVKNYACLIRAAQRIFAAVPNAALLFVGDGPLQAELTALTRQLGIANHVHFLNWRKDVAQILRELDVFVLSSFSEGMSNSILEAMAARRPVVATAVGGNTELVIENETGRLVPSDHDEQMAAAVLALLRDDAQRLSMGAAARQRIETLFTLPQMLRNYQRVYIEVAARHFTFHPELRERINQHFGGESVVLRPNSGKPVTYQKIA
jgi:sugar transferase (PEP-CTERM/EpsH1 system associated)